MTDLDLLLQSVGQSLPDRLGTALPGQAGSGKGLPEAECSEPLTGRDWTGSPQAGGRKGAPFLIASPSGEDMPVILQGLDRLELEAAQAVYQGLSTPLTCMKRVYVIRAWKARVLDALGWQQEAAEVRERVAREVAA